MTIKQMLNKKIVEWGVPVLHLSSSKYFKCRCIDPVNKQGNTNCNICFGSGSVSSLKIINVIMDMNGATRENEKLNGFGLTDSTPIQIYTKYNNILSQRDKIIVVGFDKNGNPTDIKDIYVINNTNSFRMLNGRIEGNVCTATKVNSDIKIYQKYINNLHNKAIEHLKDGGEYVCRQ